MGEIDKDWFDPARLFDEGYPEGLTSALRALPDIRAQVVDELRALKAERILEVGPGDLPLSEQAVYLDVVPGFLRKLSGPRVVASLLHAPFCDDAFDAVVCSDVLTHIPPPQRRGALTEVARLGRIAFIFNPEPGTPQVSESPVQTDEILAFFDELDWRRVRTRRFIAWTGNGEYHMTLIQAWR